jgi:hypothetical protein
MDATDRVNELLVETLSQALSVPGEHRLYRAGKLAGLFPGRGAASVESAHFALDEGLLQRVRVETRGKAEIEWVQIAPKGVEFLHAHESPVHALHEMRATLRANREAVPLWLEAMRAGLRDLENRLSADADRWLDRLGAMDRRIGDTLRRLEAAAPLVPTEVLEAHPWAVDALNYLDRREGAGATDACSLPELFAAVAGHHARLSLTGFHDGMRRLHQRRAVRLMPADDPAKMTRPEFALLDAGGMFYLVRR